MRRFLTPARLYLLLGPVFGVLWFVVIVGLWIAGLFGQLVLLAFLTIVVAQLLLRPIGRFERFLAVSLLGQEVQQPKPLQYRRFTGARRSGVVNAFRRSLAVFQDGHSWRVLAWVLARIFLGPLGFTVVVLPVALVLVPLAVVVDTASDDISMGFAGKYWLLFAPAGLILLPVLLRAADAMVGVHRRLVVWALGPGHREIVAATLARAAQAEEQVRIDQELHDSIGHMLSMIVVQAGAGAYVFDKDPEFARRALGTIEQRGRAALGELDRIITKIEGGAARARQVALPDGHSLPALIDSAREAGVNITARIHADELTGVVGSGVYRIVQEAITNAAKHAPGKAVRVDIATGVEAVAVWIANDFHGMAPVPGRGLASIRDRAALLGGQATVGLADGREFVASAVLPLTAMFPGDLALECLLTRRCGCAGCLIRRSVLG